MQREYDYIRPPALGFTLIAVPGQVLPNCGRRRVIPNTGTNRGQ